MGTTRTQGPQVWVGSRSGDVSTHFEGRDCQHYGLNSTSYADELGGPVDGTPTLQGSGVSASRSSSQRQTGAGIWLQPDAGPAPDPLGVGILGL